MRNYNMVQYTGGPKKHLGFLGKTGWYLTKLFLNSEISCHLKTIFFSWNKAKNLDFLHVYYCNKQFDKYLQAYKFFAIWLGYSTNFRIQEDFCKIPYSFS